MAFRFITHLPRCIDMNDIKLKSNPLHRFLNKLWLQIQELRAKGGRLWGAVGETGAKWHGWGRRALKGLNSSFASSSNTFHCYHKSRPKLFLCVNFCAMVSPPQKPRVLIMGKLFESFYQIATDCCLVTVYWQRYSKGVNWLIFLQLNIADKKLL